MFLDLEASLGQYEDVEQNFELMNNIRSRYGLNSVANDKNSELDNLFDANITSALEIKIESDLEIPIQESTTSLDEREIIVEETVGNESDIEDTNMEEFKEESESTTSFKEFDEESDELEDKTKRKRKGRKEDDDAEIFEWV